MMGMMKNLWKPQKVVDMDVISDNKFLFTFYSRADIDQVLECMSWSFERHVLLTKEVSPMEQPNKIVLNRATFWLRLYDLPTGAMKESIISKLGSKAGRVINIGCQRDNYLGGRYARLRIELDIIKPLTRGTQLQIRGNEPIFIQFR